MFNMNATVSGLTTFTVGIPEAGRVPVSGKLALPTIPAGDTSFSQVVVTIVQTPSGGSPTTIYTGAAGSEGFAIIANCAAADSIAITMSSGAAVDKQLNTIKTTISVG